jgi:hypothetical protein
MKILYENVNWIKVQQDSIQCWTLRHDKSLWHIKVGNLLNT